MKEDVEIRWTEEVDSTNSEAIRRASEFDNLSVLAAFNQTAGRGQRGNTWLAPKGKNLTFTMVLRFGAGGFPPLEAKRQFILTRCITLGITDYLSSQGIPATIKWPNDIYVRNMKICGILIENILRGPFLKTSYIGIGLNVNQKEFPPQLVNPVSMALLTGKEYSIVEQLPELCSCIRRRLDSRDNADEYISRLYRIGVFNEYVIAATGKSIVARIVDVSESGLLRLETEKGEPFEFSFKEINYVI